MNAQTSCDSMEARQLVDRLSSRLENEKRELVLFLIELAELDARKLIVCERSPRSFPAITTACVNVKPGPFLGDGFLFIARVSSKLRSFSSPLIPLPAGLFVSASRAAEYDSSLEESSSRHTAPEITPPEASRSERRERGTLQHRCANTAQIKLK